MIEEIGDDSEIERSSAKALSRTSIFCYGVGHMLNDVTSACWFTYLLLFLTEIGLTPRDAATVMLSGQIADAFATILAGELLDRFGHFKFCHAAGSVLVAISFSSVFGGCLPCKIFRAQSAALQTIGYSFFAAIFNVGWAATQVSHMSMVNCITLNPTSRVVLASCRNACTMVANLGLYAIAFAIFNLFSVRTSIDIENQYRWIAYLSILFGCCFVGIFLVGTKEPSLKQHIQSKNCQRISWKFWFKKVLYYQVAIVYVLTRIVANVSQALLTFYVINDLRMSQSSKAVVPAIIYICSFGVSITLQEMRWSGRRLKAFFTFGAVLWTFSGAGILFLSSNLSSLMYLLAISIGVANALMTVTGVSMQSFLVGKELYGSAFVYASLGFLDKVSCGLALYVLESYQSSSPSLGACDATGRRLSISRYGLGLVPALCAILGVGVTYTMDLRTGSNALLEPLLV
ncbi:hypothetical protein H6P81_011089 [Aristolochia fimbriata]|uniref:Major facilitator superfamily domain-containing protein 12 n=1 Tax=Aristolochia fimbriata TaxID=158543 RepID=A0AAV7ER94_ARIFI|nr:hypothetical protein H6P81_011089 [Aristolochia fimbriata]